MEFPSPVTDVDSPVPDFSPSYHSFVLSCTVSLSVFLSLVLLLIIFSSHTFAFLCALTLTQFLSLSPFGLFTSPLSSYLSIHLSLTHLCFLSIFPTPSSILPPRSTLLLRCLDSTWQFFQQSVMEETHERFRKFGNASSARATRDGNTLFLCDFLPYIKGSYV